MPADFYSWELDGGAFGRGSENARPARGGCGKSSASATPTTTWSSGPRAYDEISIGTCAACAVTNILEAHGIRYRLEFLGPHELFPCRRTRLFTRSTACSRSPDAAGGYAGVVFDTFHWYCSTNGDRDTALHGAARRSPRAAARQRRCARRPLDRQRDLERRLPMETGVIDSRAVFRRLNTKDCGALCMIGALRAGPHALSRAHSWKRPSAKSRRAFRASADKTPPLRKPAEAHRLYTEQPTDMTGGLFRYSTPACLGRGGGRRAASCRSAPNARKNERWLSKPDSAAISVTERFVPASSAHAQSTDAREVGRKAPARSFPKHVRKVEPAHAERAGQRLERERLAKCAETYCARSGTSARCNPRRGLRCSGAAAARGPARAASAREQTARSPPPRFSAVSSPTANATFRVERLGRQKQVCRVPEQQRVGKAARQGEVRRRRARRGSPWKAPCSCGSGSEKSRQGCPVRAPAFRATVTLVSPDRTKKLELRVQVQRKAEPLGHDARQRIVPRLEKRVHPRAPFSPLFVLSQHMSQKLSFACILPQAML